MRINLFAGACAGKSTTGAWLFSELKRAGFSVEFAREYIKKFTYLAINPSEIDQREVFHNQLDEELIPLQGGVKNVVTESPIHLSYIYPKLYGKKEFAAQILRIASVIDSAYESVSVYLDRGSKPFKPEGRWGTLEDAIKADDAIKEFLAGREKKGHIVLRSSWEHKDEILDFAKSYCNV